MLRRHLEYRPFVVQINRTPARTSVSLASLQDTHGAVLSSFLQDEVPLCDPSNPKGPGLKST